MFVVWLSIAVASPFQEKTMKENLPNFPLGSAFFLPKGRMSIQTEVASKNIVGFRDQNGQIQRYENTNFKYNGLQAQPLISLPSVPINTQPDDTYQYPYIKFINTNSENENGNGNGNGENDESDENEENDDEASNRAIEIDPNALPSTTPKIVTIGNLTTNTVPANRIITPSNPPWDQSADHNTFITGKYCTENVSDIMTSWGLVIDGKYRENVLPAGALQYIEKYVRTSGNSPNGVFCYNFSINTDPFDLQPSGAMNLSKFSNIEFEINTTTPPLDENAKILTVCDSNGDIIGIKKPIWNIYKYTYDLTILEERYNILKFESGTAGLVYTR